MMVIGVTALALCAGVVAGMVAARLPATGSAAKPGASAPGDASPAGLAEQLDLSTDQREQMRHIWEGVRDDVRQSFESAEALQRQRDEAVATMLTDAQKEKFAKIAREYSDRFDALRRRRDDRFANAVERTRNLLNDQQRRKYDELLKAHVRPDELKSIAAGAASTTTAPASMHRSREP
jgi:Spy/CpxP family protein refolding chaperone